MLKERPTPFSSEPSWDVAFTLNGEAVQLKVDPTWTLYEVLREQLDLTGTKGACLEGECGSCTVLIDGVSMNACLTMAAQVEGKAVLSVEGLSKDGEPDPVQEAFIRCGAVQCGYCTPGLVVAAKAFLAECPKPSVEDVRKGLEGNICRCTGYMRIEQAVLEAAEAIAAGAAKA